MNLCPTLILVSTRFVSCYFDDYASTIMIFILKYPFKNFTFLFLPSEEWILSHDSLIFIVHNVNNTEWLSRKSLTREIKIVEICGRMWKPQTSFEGNDISEFLGIYGKRGGAISIKILHANAISGVGIVIMKVIVSWRRGRNCWRSTFDVATDQLRSLNPDVH